MIQPIIAVLVSSVISIRAYRKKSLDLSGALAGFIVMTLHISVNYRHVSSISLNWVSIVSSGLYQFSSSSFDSINLS